jgi:hypothetical protein
MIQFDSIEIIKFTNDNTTARRFSMSVDEYELRRSIRQEEEEEENCFDKIAFNRMSTACTESPLHQPERRKSNDLGDAMFDRMQTVAPLAQPLKQPKRRISDKI